MSTAYSPSVRHFLFFLPFLRPNGHLTLASSISPFPSPGKKQMKEESEDKVSVKFLPVTPVCLVDKDKTKKAVPLFSLTGDLLGNKDDYR